MIEILEKRFNEHPERHGDITWDEVKSYLEEHEEVLEILKKMEETGGEVDLFLIDGSYYYVDASKETPKRVSLCYDKEARVTRKKNAPASSVSEEAEKLGSTLVDEAMYKKLQEIESFDQKTSTWLKTEDEVRLKGGAIFGDRRYDRVFIYHNGADSYYASRGFRTFVELKGLIHE